MFVGILQKINGFIKKNWRLICVLIFMLLFVIFAQRYGIDKEITVFVVLFLGYVTQLFGTLVGFIAAIPVIGPPIASLLSLPFLFIVNGIAYIVTFFSLRKGYAKEVLGSRFLVTAFLVGIVVGYALGKVL
jgi:hypothetical protein